MRSSHVLSRLTHSFDEPNLVSHAGLSAPSMLAQRIDLDALVAATVKVPGPCGANMAAKVATVLGGMLAGADSIDDLDVLRAGAAPTLFNDMRAPSTIGSWLRSFTFGNVRQLDAVSREVRVRLWGAGVGPHRLDGRLFVDVDSTIAEAYGPPLTDAEAHRGEQVAIMELFAGAIGAFKNPPSHRTVHFDDPLEAAEVVQTADLLLRLLRRAEVRMTS